MRVCTEWLETRWESNPLGKCWAGGSSIRAEDQMELNISAEARVGKLMATRDEMTSPGVMMLHKPQQLEKRPGKTRERRNSRTDFKLEMAKCSSEYHFCQQVELELEIENMSSRITSLSAQGTIRVPPQKVILRAK